MSDRYEEQARAVADELYTVGKRAARLIVADFARRCAEEAAEDATRRALEAVDAVRDDHAKKYQRAGEILSPSVAHDVRGEQSKIIVALTEARNRIATPTGDAQCGSCPHPPHLGACTRRNGQTANPCPCLRDTPPPPRPATGDHCLNPETCNPDKGRALVEAARAVLPMTVYVGAGPWLRCEGCSSSWMPGDDPGSVKHEADCKVAALRAALAGVES